jgi:hypothetical protein
VRPGLLNRNLWGGTTPAMSNLQTLEVVPFEPNLCPTWDAFVRSARNSHFFFQRGYLEYHRDRFEDRSLLVYSGDRLLALLPANVDGGTFVSHQGLTFGGFLVDHRMTGALMIGVFCAVLDYLRGRRVRHIVYKAIPHIYNREPTEEDLCALHLLGAKVVRRDLSSALALGEGPRYTKGRKLNLAKAVGADCAVVRSEDYGSFARLLESVIEQRHHVRRSTVQQRWSCWHAASRTTSGSTEFTARVCSSPTRWCSPIPQWCTPSTLQTRRRAARWVVSTSCSTG